MRELSKKEGVFRQDFIKGYRKSKENLNKSNTKQKIMNVEETEIYERLKFLLNNDRLKIDRKRRNQNVMQKQIDNFLISEGLIDLNKSVDNTNFLLGKRYVTQQGYEKYCVLRTIYKSDYSLIINILRFVAMFIVAVLAFFVGKGVS